MPRDSGDFIKELRVEIENAKRSRSRFVYTKLAFVAGLLGTGVASVVKGKLGPPSQYLFYLAPFVVAALDMYISSEDYGIKRAGFFIRKSPEAPQEERDWEHLCRKYRPKRRIRMAGITIAILAFVVSGAALYLLDTSGHVGVSGSKSWSQAHRVFLIWLFPALLALGVSIQAIVEEHEFKKRRHENNDPEDDPEV